MISTRSLKAFSLLACCLGGLLLAGCNNSDPYAGQDVKGPVLLPSKVNPLDTSQPATQVALLINRPVEGLSYSCDDVNGTRDETADFSSQSSTGSSSSTNNSADSNGVPVARCGNDAYSVTYYLGGKDPSGISVHVDLGTIYLPIATPTGQDSAGNTVSRFDTSKNSVAQSTFLFNFSLLDAQTSPARLVVAGSLDSQGNCVVTPNDACQVVYKAALLQALGGTGTVINIPESANNLVANTDGSRPPGLVIPTGFNYASYGAFTAAWNDYLQAVVPGGVFPAATDVIASLDTGAARLRSGVYSMDYASLNQTYALGYYNSSCLLLEVTDLSADVLAYPDGRLVGFGNAGSDLGKCNGQSNPKSDFVTVTGSAGGYASLSDGLQLNALNLSSVTSQNGGASVSVFGRFFGTFLYDGRTPQVVNPQVSASLDFAADFPKATSYVLQDSEKGSFTGQLFGLTLPSYLPGNTIGVGQLGNYMQPMPYPIRMNKSTVVQAAPLDTSVMALLPQNYRIQLMQLCGPATTGLVCNTIPSQDIGSSGNYPTTACIFYQQAADGTVNCTPGSTITITQETPRESSLGAGDNGVINLHFDVSAGNDSAIVELLDANCAPVLDGQGNPLRVGLVTATPNSSAVSHKTADIYLLFSPPDTASLSKVPQLGVVLSGRIDLQDAGSTTTPAPAMPIYRLGDDNFNAHIRARWVDTHAYRLTKYAASLPSTDPDNLTAAQRTLAISLGSGAVSGQALNASCQPLPQ